MQIISNVQNVSSNVESDDDNIIENDFSELQKFLENEKAELQKKIENSKDEERRLEKEKIEKLAKENNMEYVEYFTFDNFKAFSKYVFERKQKRCSDLIKSAGVPKIFDSSRANDFIVTSNNENTAETAIKCITDNKGLFIYGECGTGKTMLASIIANERAELSKPSMFIRAVDIFHELNPFFAEDKQAPIRKRHIMHTTPCLIIDDLGAEKPSDFTRATLFDVLDHRMNENLQTVITTNFNIDELKNRLNSKEELNLSEKIIRRITATCQLVELKHY